jgi:hypothetical protein
MSSRLVAVVALALAACGGGATGAPAPAVPGAVPVPDALARQAKPFGLRMLAEGFTWTPIDPATTRFQWSGRSPDGDREILYSFWLPKLGAAEKKVLPQIVQTAAANLAEGSPCAPHEQPRDFAQVLGVDRVISVCFETAPFYAKEYRHGIVHGIVNDDALTIVAVLSNDRNAAFVPLPKSIGARGN